MPFSIELRFDPVSESRILDIWKETANFYGSPYLLENGAIPHLALVVGDFPLRNAFEGLNAPSGNIKLSGTHFFGNGDVAYLQAGLPEEIHEFQQTVHDAALRLGAQMDPYYHPGSWVPHCSIAQKCRTKRNETCSEYGIEVSIHSLLLVEYPPTALIAEKFCQSP